jgi:hypothetical protein
VPNNSASFTERRSDHLDIGPLTRDVAVSIVALCLTDLQGSIGFKNLEVQRSEAEAASLDQMMTMRARRATVPLAISITLSEQRMNRTAIPCD